MGGSDDGLIYFCFCYYCCHYHQLLFVEHLVLSDIMLKHWYILAHLPVPKISSKYSGMVKVAQCKDQETFLLL